MSSVTHELRTPLTSIRALAEVMRDDAEMPAEQRQEFLGIIVAETERLTPAGQPGAGHGQDRVRPCRMAQQRRRPARAADAGGAHHRGQCSASAAPASCCSCPDAVPHAARRRRPADAGAAEPAVQRGQVRAAGQRPRRAARWTPTPRARPCRCTTTAPACRPSSSALIFEKFRQGGDALNRPQGTGLGLPISRQIVEHFGGRMGLRDDPEQGACFCFTLPWRRTRQHTETRHDAQGR